MDIPEYLAHINRLIDHDVLPGLYTALEDQKLSPERVENFVRQIQSDRMLLENGISRATFPALLRLVTAIGDIRVLLRHHGYPFLSYNTVAELQTGASYIVARVNRSPRLPATGGAGRRHHSRRRKSAKKSKKRHPRRHRRV
jgi:predicted TIM-barrel fold metal-dependent hydrolase